MDATTSSSTQAAFAATEPAKRFLDPLAEWRDCANQWDVSEVWRTPVAAPDSGPNERAETTIQATGR